LVSDARRNVRLYTTIKDRKSPLKGSRPSVPHGANFLFFSFSYSCDFSVTVIVFQLLFLFQFILSFFVFVLSPGPTQYGLRSPCTELKQQWFQYISALQLSFFNMSVIVKFCVNLMCAQHRH